MMHGYLVEPRKGHVKPFQEWREIQRGKNRGRIEVVLPNNRPSRVIVEKDAIRRWPERG